MRSRFHLTFAVLAALPTLASAQPAQSTQPALIVATAAEKVNFLRAVVNAPALTAALRRTDAARERVGAAGRLADVEVEGMGSRMVGPMDERATMWEVNVRQPLPKRGERAADRERARAGVSLAEADYALMAGDMAADTAMALAEASGAQARIRLLETQISRLDAVLRSVDTRIASGSGRLADRLTVQTRLASMQLMMEEERRMSADALAEAQSRLGLKSDEPLPIFAAPSPADVNVSEAAVLRLAAARADEANSRVKMARASANPMTSVGVRFEQERRVMGDENTFGLAFMTEIPWRNRRYARSEVKAAEADRAAAEADGAAARYRIASVITRVARAERLAETARRLSQETLSRLTAEFDAMIRSAGVGGTNQTSTVFESVELLEKATDTELQVIRADIAVNTARAELWRYISATDFPSAK